MPPDLDEPLSTALSALRLEALAGPLSAAGLCSLETLESDVLASRTHFLARLKEAQVGTIPQRQALANGLLRRRRDGDAPVWLRPSDRHLQLSAWHWQSYADASRPAAAASAPGAYLRARWRAADGPAAPALAVSSRAGEPLPMVLTVRYAGCAPTRLRPVADAAGLVALPAPPAEEVHVYELTVQIEAAVQSADRWGSATPHFAFPARSAPAPHPFSALARPRRHQLRGRRPAQAAARLAPPLRAGPAAALRPAAAANRGVAPARVWRLHNLLGPSRSLLGSF